MSLSVVGGLYPNKDGSNRLFEMSMCLPGEPVRLVREPRNKADPSAVAVFSARNIQLGYLSAERCGWIGAMIIRGEGIRAVFHYAGGGVAVIRVSFGGEEPKLPHAPVPGAGPRRSTVDIDHDGFYPDEMPDDD